MRRAVRTLSEAVSNRRVKMSGCVIVACGVGFEVLQVDYGIVYHEKKLFYICTK